MPQFPHLSNGARALHEGREGSVSHRSNARGETYTWCYLSTELAFQMGTRCPRSQPAASSLCLKVIGRNAGLEGAQ